MGRQVTRKDAAEIFGVTVRTFDVWRKDGLEAASGEGRGVLFDTVTVLNWLLERERGGLDLTKEKAKLTRIQTRKTELEVAKMEGDLVSAEEITAEYDLMAGAICAKMRAVPPRAAAQVVAASTVDEIEDMLTDMIDEALEVLPEHEFAAEIEEVLAAHFAANEAAAEAERKRVGRRKKTAQPGGKRRGGEVAH